MLLNRFGICLLCTLPAQHLGWTNGGGPVPIEAVVGWATGEGQVNVPRQGVPSQGVPPRGVPPRGVPRQGSIRSGSDASTGILNSGILSTGPRPTEIRGTGTGPRVSAQETKQTLEDVRLVALFDTTTVLERARQMTPAELLGRFDRDRDGRLNPIEDRHARKEQAVRHSSRVALIQRLDSNKNGRLDAVEMSKARSEAKAERRKKILLRFDLNENGVLDPREREKLAQKRSRVQMLKPFVFQFDENGNRSLEAAEEAALLEFLATRKQAMGSAHIRGSEGAQEGLAPDEQAPGRESHAPQRRMNPRNHQRVDLLGPQGAQTVLPVRKEADSNADSTPDSFSGPSPFTSPQSSGKHSGIHAPGNHAFNPHTSTSRRTGSKAGSPVAQGAMQPGAAFSRDVVIGGAKERGTAKQHAEIPLPKGDFLAHRKQPLGGLGR